MQHNPVLGGTFHQSFDRQRLHFFQCRQRLFFFFHRRIFVGRLFRIRLSGVVRGRRVFGVLREGRRPQRETDRDNGNEAHAPPQPWPAVRFGKLINDKKTHWPAPWFWVCTEMNPPSGEITTGRSPNR